MSEQEGEVFTRLRFLQSLIESDEHRKTIFGRDGKLRFNQMTETVELGGKSVGVEDKDLVPLRWRIAEMTKRTFNTPLEPSAPNLRAIIEHVADADAYHPVEEWITALKWDGVDRLAVEMPKAFGHEAESLEAAMLRKMFRAMAGRAIKPGCKADAVIVFVGPQGKFKSTTLAALASPWFTDQHVDVSNKDSLEVCHRHWLIEFGELGSVRGKDIEQVKAFVSKVDDCWRSSYARKSQVRKRRFVMVGTTNNMDFLTDPTGNRRWWPIPVFKPIDTVWIGMHRDQLFAQAAHEVLAGAVWWLDPDEEAQRVEKAENHMEVDPWESKIKQWMDDNQDIGRRGATVAEILNSACDVAISNMHSGLSRRVSSTMRRLGASQFRNSQSRTWKWSMTDGDRLSL